MFFSIYCVSFLVCCQLTWWIKLREDRHTHKQTRPNALQHATHIHVLYIFNCAQKLTIALNKDCIEKNIITNRLVDRRTGPRRRWYSHRKDHASSHGGLIPPRRPLTGGRRHPSSVISWLQHRDLWAAMIIFHSPIKQKGNNKCKLTDYAYVYSQRLYSAACVYAAHCSAWNVWIFYSTSVV